MPNDDFVSKAVCSETMEPLRKDMETVLKALVGDDLRGGLVKDVAEIKASLKARWGCEQKAGLGKREYALIAVAVIGAIASVIVATVEALIN